MQHAIGCIVETLTALRLGKIKQIRLTDWHQTAVIRSHSLTLTDSTVPITSVWLDAVCNLLVDVCLNGWTDTAHLDADFGKICVCIAAAPPSA